MPDQNYNILAVYRPALSLRILDICFAILLILPVLLLLYLHYVASVEVMFIFALSFWCLLYATRLVARAFRFRLIVTDEGLIFQEFGRRLVPYEAMVCFDSQIPSHSRYATLPKLGIVLDRRIGTEMRGLSALFSLRDVWLNTRFLELRYVSIPKHFGIFRREINFEKFIETEFGQILYEHAPQLFPQS